MSLAGVPHIPVAVVVVITTVNVSSASVNVVWGMWGSAARTTIAVEGLQLACYARAIVHEQREVS